jgi:hypothetical protein
LSANSGPGCGKGPNQRVPTWPAGVRERVTFNGEIVADSRDAIRPIEALPAGAQYQHGSRKFRQSGHAE